ncbi:MAG: DUF3572 domain-containing protein [Bosea sp. (in: a-proteobacteria)]
MLRPKNNQDAEGMAINALGFLASDPERLGRFLSVTGLGPENLRAAAGEPAFLLSVLDYVASDESLLLALAGHLSIRPETITQARQRMAGPNRHDD